MPKVLALSGLILAILVAVLFALLAFTSPGNFGAEIGMFVTAIILAVLSYFTWRASD